MIGFYAGRHITLLLVQWAATFLPNTGAVQVGMNARALPSLRCWFCRLICVFLAADFTLALLKEADKDTLTRHLSSYDLQVSLRASRGLLFGAGNRLLGDLLGQWLALGRRLLPPDVQP